MLSNAIEHEWIAKWCNCFNENNLITICPHVTIDFNFFAMHRKYLKENPHQRSNYTKMHNCMNPNITISRISKYPNKKWSWCEISKHKNITMSMIENNIRFPWVWKSVCQNPNFTLDMVVKHPDISWDFNLIKFIFLDNDFITFTEHGMKTILLLAIHEYYQETFCWNGNIDTVTDLERIFADDYLVKQIIGY